VGGCPLTAALAAIGGKWKLTIVYWLADRPKLLLVGFAQKLAVRADSPPLEEGNGTQYLRLFVQSSKDVRL